MQSTRYSCQISTVLNFLNRLLKNPQTSNLKKIHPVGTELFHADGQTDRQTDRDDKDNCHFLQF